MRKRRTPASLSAAALIPVAVLSIAACEGPTVPPNTTADIYDYRLETTPPSVIRWPSGTRVRVYVADAPGTREDMLSAGLASGAAEWNRHALFGEYELVRATSIAAADVVLRWSDEPVPVVDMSGCPPVFANAVTTFCLRDDDPSRLHVFPIAANTESPGSVRFVITVLGAQSGNPDNVARLVLHELGHVLGIGQHSPDSSDLMSAGVPTRNTLSVADIATVQILYHTRPHITP